MSVNILEPRFIDRKGLDAKFSFWRLYNDSSSRGIAYGSKLLDAQAQDGNKGLIRSIVYDAHNNLWVMLDADMEDPREFLKSVIRDSGEDSIAIKEYSAGTLEDHLLIQLLLNSLTMILPKQRSLNNVSGRLFCIVRFNPKKGYKQVVSLEIRLQKDMTLLLNTRTFTSLVHKKEMTESRHSLDLLPRYRLSKYGELYRVFDEYKDVYVQRQCAGFKSSIPYISFGKIKDKATAFRRCKIGILAEVLRAFEKRYGQYIELSFKDPQDFGASLRQEIKVDKETWRTEVKEALQGQTLNMIDRVGSKKSKEMLTKLSSGLEQEYALAARGSHSICSSSINIVLVHNDTYYQDRKLDDQYHTHDTDLVVHHVTLENFKGAAAQIDGLAKELLYKLDIQSQQMTAHDWVGFNFDQDWTFVQFFKAQSKDSSEEHAYAAFLDIDPKGGLSFSLEAADRMFFTAQTRHEKLIQNKPEQAWYGISNDKGQINYILETKFFTLPNMDHLKACLEQETSPRRRNENYENEYKDLVDMYWVEREQDQSAWYYVGNERALRMNVEHAVLIREMRAAIGSSLFMKDYLSLMEFDKVRVRKPTVVPFPFKYLREWLDIQIRLGRLETITEFEESLDAQEG